MSVPQDDERVLILAPTGRDAELARAAFAEAGLSACVCRESDDMLRELASGAGAALITWEALTPPMVVRLTETLAAQPAWSDLPLVILTSGAVPSAVGRHRVETLGALGNVTLLERPLRVPTLVSVLRVALGARRRQYELREHLRERERLERALLAEYEKQHHIAETLQRSLLSPPALGAFPNLAVASLYQAARSEADIGGDFFDAFALNGERVALVVGDVSGKGLEAASRTAEVKYALRAFLREDASPAGALDRANDFLLDTQMLDGQSLSSFVCVALGVLEAETGVLHIAGAGAEAPLLLRADGGAEAVAGNGPPLGVTAMAEYTEHLVHLSAGDTVVFVTDGVTEARRGREFFGYEGFVETAQRVGARESLESLGQAIIGDASDFAGGKLGDDVCLLLARYDPPPASSP